jgi:hypothetical protein
VKYARATECLTKDKEALLAFYDMPAEHWDHPGDLAQIRRHRRLERLGYLVEDVGRLVLPAALVSAGCG